MTSLRAMDACLLSWDWLVHLVLIILSLINHVFMTLKSTIKTGDFYYFIIDNHFCFNFLY